MTDSERNKQAVKEFNERNSSWVKAAQTGGDKAGAIKNDALLRKKKADDQAEEIRSAIPKAENITQKMRDEAVARHSPKMLMAASNEKKATAPLQAAANPKRQPLQRDPKEGSVARAKQVEEATYDAGKDYDETFSPLYRKLANAETLDGHKPFAALGAISKEKYRAMADGKYSNILNQVEVKPQHTIPGIRWKSKDQQNTEREARVKKSRDKLNEELETRVKKAISDPKKDRSDALLQIKSDEAHREPTSSETQQPLSEARAARYERLKSKGQPATTAKAPASRSRHDDGRHQIDDAMKGNGPKEEAKLANAEKLQGPELRPLKFKARPRRNPRNIA